MNKETRVIKFRYICVKPTPFVFSRFFTIDEIERGDVTTWIERNYANAGIIYRNQFTGLQDKNGKDIYEGDIVRSFQWIYDSIMMDVDLEVYFWNGTFSVKNIKDEKDGEYLWDVNRTCEIIGNIYEHSNLLNHEIKG